MTGMNAKSQPVNLTGPADCARFDVSPGAGREAERNEHDERRDLQRRQDIAGEAARPDAADVNERGNGDDRARRQRVPGEGEHDGREGHRDREQRRRVRDARHEAIECGDEEHCAGRHRATEARDERGPPGQEAGKRPVRLAQIDILAARFRAERGELRIRHRAHEREHAAADPREQKPGRVRHRGRDCRRSERGFRRR